MFVHDGLLVGAPLLGAGVLVYPDAGAGITWSVDATSGKGVPADATEWGDVFASLGFGGAPSNLWLMQEASGNLADSIGSVALNRNSTPSYQNVVTGWSRAAVGTSDGVTAYWSTSGGPDTSTTSIAMLVYLRLDSATAERGLISVNSSTNDFVLVNATAAGILRGYCDTSNASGSVNYEGGDVFPLLLVYDRSNSRFVVYTHQETFTVAYGSVSSSGITKRVGSAPAASALYLYGCWWGGADAEALSTDANAKALLEALGWTVTGY